MRKIIIGAIFILIASKSFAETNAQWEQRIFLVIERANELIDELPYTEENLIKLYAYALWLPNAIDQLIISHSNHRSREWRNQLILESNWWNEIRPIIYQYLGNYRLTHENIISRSWVYVQRLNDRWTRL